MTEDSRDDLRARVRKLNAISEAMKNHPLPPHVSEMTAKLEEFSQVWSLGDTSPSEAPRPAASPTPNPSVPASVVVVASKDTTSDPDRRLARLRALGGDAIYKRTEWKFRGITALVKSEKSEHRKRSDEKTIRADLKEAAQNEREARRAGFADGLGQR